MVPRHRPRTRVAADQTDADRRTWYLTLALLASVIFAFLVAIQTTAALSGAALTPEQSEPQGTDPPGDDDTGQGESGQDLSERLKQQDGVIAPPETGDTGIHAQTPEADESRTPVIPPPGSPGGDQSVDPR